MCGMSPRWECFLWTGKQWRPRGPPYEVLCCLTPAVGEGAALVGATPHLRTTRSQHSLWLQQPWGPCGWSSFSKQTPDP